MIEILPSSALPDEDRKERQISPGSTILANMAHTLSFVLHPFFIPLIGVALLLFGNTLVSGMSLWEKLFLLGVIFLSTVLFPLLSVVMLRLFDIIPDLNLESRNERVLPLVFVATGYALCNYILSDYVVGHIVHKVIYGGVASLAVCFMINFHWKISLHMTAIGGLCGLLYTMEFLNYGTLYFTFLLFLFFAGLLGAARLILGKHTPMQLLAGFCVGFSMMGLSMYLI